MSIDQYKAKITERVGSNGMRGITGEELKEVFMAGADAMQEVQEQTKVGINLGFLTPSSAAAPATGIHRGQAAEAGTYTNFKDAANASIVVSAADLDVVNGAANYRVIIEVKEGVASKYRERVKGEPAAANPVFNPENNTEAPTMKGAADYTDAEVDKIVDKTPITETVFNAGDTYTAQLTTSTFSGFGQTYGIKKNFNRISILYKDRADIKKATKMWFMIREDSHTGAILAQGFKDLSVADGSVTRQDFSFPLIENSTNKVIWIEYSVNGKTDWLVSTTVVFPATAWRYKTYSMVDGVSFETQSAIGSPPTSTTTNCINLYRDSTTLKLNESLMTDKIEVSNEKAVKSKTVFAEFRKYDYAISDGFLDETKTILGGDTSVSAISTFTGWGQNKGKIKNFNRIGYKVRAFDAALIPTKLVLNLRKNTSAGDVLYRIEKTDLGLAHNVDKIVYFDLPEVFTNAPNDDIFVSINADGRLAGIFKAESTNYPTGYIVAYSTTLGAETTPAESTLLSYNLYLEVIKGSKSKVISDAEIQRILNKIPTPDAFANPNVLLTSKVWIYPTAQYNIFDKNVIVPAFGDNLENYRADYSGSVGQQLKRGFRMAATPSLNQNITLNLLKGRNNLATKTQNILTPTAANGTGVNRNVLIVGDSTAAGAAINTPLKTVFDADLMDVTFVGTIGAAGLKHEGRGGWTFNNYYGFGVKYFRVDVSGMATPPTTGAIYRQTSGNDFRVMEVNITAGTGYFKVEMATGTADLAASGTLTKQSGTGETVINYTGSTADSANPFYSATTGKFDVGYYLTTTGQTMANGDWIFFQLGINDMFGITDLPSAVTKVNTIITQLNEMLANITAYNANIRVGIVVTIPAAGQDGFGANYALGQTSEMYQRTGLVTLQKKLIEIYDTDAQRTANRYLVSAHLNLDTDYNFPNADVAVNSRNTKTVNMQNNGVHPDVNGNAQIADMYAGLIKYFA